MDETLFEDGCDRHREDPLRQLVKAERLVDRRRRLFADQGANEAVDQGVEVDQAEADRLRQQLLSTLTCVAGEDGNWD
ncbi:MAG TPA: hypothetical protein VHP56_03450 [Solirubrobacterales bacterium]|nr:hypothetical protein [Solirubrobacterales bacterium]